MEPLKNISVVQTPGKIETNFAEIQSQLAAQMQAYEELEVTESNIPERKADVATLRKMKKAIDDRRKDVKKMYNAPLAEFEGKVKELTAIIDKQIDRINAGLSEFEQARKAEKQKHVAELYAANIGEWADFLPLEKVQAPNWLNKTCTDSDIISDIQSAVIRVREEVSIIKLLRSEIEDELIEVYKRTGSVNAAVMRSNDYNSAKALAAQKAAEDAQEAAETRPEPKVEEVHEEELQCAPTPSEWGKTATFRVFGEDAIEAVREFFDLASIQYEEVV